MVIKNVTIYTMEDGILKNGWLRTNGKIIEDFGSGEAPAEDGSVFDGSGGVLLPGLVDAHTHIGLIEDGLGFEGDDGNEDTDPATPALGAIDAINPFDRCFAEAREAGVTTVLTGPGSANPVGGQMAVVKTRGRRVDDMVLKYPAAMKFALGENPKTEYHGKDMAPVTRMATAAIIREQLTKAQRYRDKLALSQEDEDTDEPEYDARCEALIPVLERKVQAHFHAHRADDIFTAIRIAREFDLDYAVIHCTEGHLIADELRQEHPAGLFSGPFLCDRCKPELKNLTPASPGILSRVGLHPCIITDHPVIPVQYLSLCAGLAVKFGMDYDEALKAVTIYPAQALGLAERIGSIQKGKDADFAIYDGDPLALSTHVVFVSIDGVRVK